MRAWIALLLLLPGPAMAQARPPLLVQAEAQTLMPFCAGQDVRIEGNHNVIKPAGLCRSLLVKGIANTVVLQLAAGATIRVEGGGNRITFRAPSPPTVEVLGTDSVVTAEASVVDDGGPNLRLAGNDRAQLVDCTGRAVSIQGDRGLYMLRGGCRSLSVRGDLVMVQAELEPGAAIAIVGHGTRVGWMLAGKGAPPTATIAGASNHVQRLAAIGGLAR